MPAKHLLLPCFLAILLSIMSGCSTVEVTSSQDPADSSPDDNVTLDVNVYFGPDNPEPATVIDFAIPEPGWVRLEVWNVTGYRVKLLLDREVEAGAVTIEWDGSNDDGKQVGSGIYMYRLQWRDQVAVKMELRCLTVEECEDMVDDD